MDASYEIRQGAAVGFPWVTFQGHVTLDAILGAIEELSPDGHYPRTSRLWDFRGCTVELSASELRRLADFGAARDREPGRVAILADSDLVYGLGRMYEVFRNSPTAEYRAFRDEATALAWLGAAEDRDA